MFFISSCSCLCPIYSSHVLNLELRCSWSSADRRCSNYIWVINNLIAYEGAADIRDLTIYCIQHYKEGISEFVITKDTPYLTLRGELWGVVCEDFEENWPSYNGNTLYFEGKSPCYNRTALYIDGLVQERRYSSALAMELRLSCTNPLERCTSSVLAMELHLSCTNPSIWISS